MRPSSSGSDVFAGVLARGGVAEQVCGRAWLQALLDFEAALARAQARAGEITTEQANEIADAVRRRPLRRRRDRRGRGRDRQPGGRRGASGSRRRPTRRCTRARRARTPIDTAAMLVDQARARAAAATTCAPPPTPPPSSPKRTATRRSSAARCSSRRSPTTFGLKAAGLDARPRRGRRRPRTACRSPCSSAGPVGTLAGPGRSRSSRLARDLGLDAPVDPLAHAPRPRSASSPARSASPRARVGKAALDVILLSQTEVAEVREAAGGGSTEHAPQAQPGRRDLRARLRQAGARPRRHAARRDGAGARARRRRVAQRMAAAVRAADATGSAASWLRTSLETLEIDADRMRANVADDPTPAPPRCSSTAHWSTDDPPPRRHRARGRARARALELARRDARDVGRRRPSRWPSASG